MQPITIVLTEGYSDWEIAPLAGVGKAFYGADIRFVSPEGGSVTSIAGLSVSGLEKFDAPEEGVVVICGGPAFEQGNPELSTRLKKAREAGCVIAGICGGTIALARAGMLDGVEHTSNGPGYLQQHAEEYAGAGSYVDQPRAIRAGDIITAPAPAPASFAAEVLAAAGLDPAKAREIPEMLGKEHAK